MVEIFNVDTGQSLVFLDLVRVDSRTIGIPFNVDTDRRELITSVKFEEASWDYDAETDLELAQLPVEWVVVDRR